MQNINLSLLSNSERRDIELQRQAALLIHNMKKGKIARLDVQREINKLHEDEQEQFKNYLNKYKELKC